jgi:putative PD-(D/E)XK family protein DUF4420
MIAWLNVLNVLNVLNDAWDELAKTSPVARQYRSRLISPDVSLEIRAGMRAIDDAPCLLLQTSVPPDALFELGGMRLSSVPDAAGPMLVLSLEDGSRRDFFATICADVVAAAASADREHALGQLLARLDAWRHFLRDRRNRLSRSETIGLIGELLILERLLAADPGCLRRWESPADGLHDFAGHGHSLEIKTGLGPAGTITISRLDQLDTSGVRRLDLLHVRLIESADGRSLQEIIISLNALLRDQAARDILENMLLRRGLLPDDSGALNIPKVHLRAIDSYNVSDGFPRLVRSSLPLAVTEASYTLEVRALSPFFADTTTILEAFLQGDNP